MKFASILITLATTIPLIANAHIHQDWMTVHRVDVRTHEIIHTASTNSLNRLAVLTIDCGKSITLFETRKYANSPINGEVWYSLDEKPLVYVSKDLIHRDANVTTYVGNVDDAINNLKNASTLKYVLSTGDGVSYSYNFSLEGIYEAYSALGELCEW
ncbi:hypothetical protein VPFG_00207 [Vibrio phage nt-1]|uniref:Uncharacterized protein n=1 Tax=Vibrio phage nt-1 TaxID=115992 RepID=R9TJD6_9CAUD|nr:hypothetical protein VPFG_00207 [Vibrio phage nt-1]AGN30207.1 hypothetical protein VPFG_00207 [Vibrio phage nt-1]